MEYCGGGSAADLMEACGKVFSEEEIVEICASVLLGLDYLHRNHNIHRVRRRWLQTHAHTGMHTRMHVHTRAHARTCAS